MRSTTILLAALLSIPPLAAAPRQDAAAPASIQLDPVHSFALFRIQHLEAGQFWGRFNALEGSVAYPLDDSAAPIFNVSVKIANADTGSEKLDGNLQGPNFFNAIEFPTMQFVSATGDGAATRVAERHWKVKGDLTIRGVTRPVEVDCVVTGIGKGPLGKKVGFECTLDIKRSDFGMKWGIETPPKVLGDAVRLVIGLEGDEKKAAAK
jgi:polyisoprenoid-binding protein YceI